MAVIKRQKIEGESKTLTVKVPRRLADKLEDRAQERYCTQSLVIIEAIEAALCGDNATPNA